MPDAYDPAYAASLDQSIDPRVSTSVGEEGGVVVLWPRIAPSSDAEALGELPRLLRDRLLGLVRQAGGDRAVDVRPEPQRVCPRSGCEAMAVGLVVLHRGGGCALAVTVSQPGPSPAHLVPWTEGTSARNTMVPFREPPESQVAVGDFVPCHAIRDAAQLRDAEVLEGIRQGLAD